jgi:nitroimidazol reductase NimA-like FMN-containing flavoprotein (pyridoxamine 5'-phosphate oxidase superfamily)
MPVLQEESIMSLKMSEAEREAFLGGVHVGVISIDRAGRAPLSVPIWYDFKPERGVWVITEKTSEKGISLAAAERFTLVAQTEEPPAYSYVSVEGPVIEVREADRVKDSRPMARRYFGEQLGDAYVASQSEDANLVFTMRPERWRTVDYGKLASPG